MSSVWGIVASVERVKQPEYSKKGSSVSTVRNSQGEELSNLPTAGQNEWYYSQANASREYAQGAAKSKRSAKRIKKQIN